MDRTSHYQSWCSDCWIQQPVSPKQAVGFTCVFNSEIDQIRRFIVSVPPLLSTQGTTVLESGQHIGVSVLFICRKGLPQKGPFGIRSGSVRANFGPKFSEPKIQNFKRKQFVRPSPPRQGPSSHRPEPRRPEGPRRGGDGCTN